MPGKVIHLGNIKELSVQQVSALCQQVWKKCFSCRIFKSLYTYSLGNCKRVHVHSSRYCLFSVPYSGWSKWRYNEVSCNGFCGNHFTLPEGKKQQRIKALKQFAESKVTVVRDDMEIIIANEELIPVDIMQLDEGMKIPADAIILQEMILL